MNLVIINGAINRAKFICILVLTAFPSFLSIAQNTVEIKDFNVSLSFSHSYILDLETNIRSDSTSDITFHAIYNIDSNGEGTFIFKNDFTKSETLVRIKHSSIKKSDGMIYMAIGGEHYKRPEKIMTTISIFAESNEVERLIVLNPTQKKAFVFY